MLVQIHILQNYAPANLNRDDTGSPKDAMFGGYRRGRISSQCLKRNIRRSETFKKAFQASDLLGVRTRLLPKLVKEELNSMGVEEDVCLAILKRLPEFGRESSKAPIESGEEDENVVGEEIVENATKQLIFIGRDEIHPLAQKLVDICKEKGAMVFGDPKKTKIQEITKELGSNLPCSVDIAMFGRMTTSEAFQNVAASVQVAHALSTNALVQEFDYYTAVDDLSDESGAGMIGDVEFNSSTYYKYLNVHLEGLVKNLCGDREIARQAVLALLEASIFSQPTGKQNSFAAFNLPDLVLVEVSKTNLPVSYTNAFIKPARAYGDRSVIDESIEKLAEYIDQTGRKFNLERHKAHLGLGEYSLPGSESVASLSALNAWLDGQIAG